MADDLYTLLQKTDPDLLEKMAAAGLYDEKSVPLRERFGIGNEMMQTPTAQGRNVGNTYVASSPIEHLSNAIRQIVGAKMAGGAMQGQGALANQVGQGNLANMAAIAKSIQLQRLASQQQPQPPQPQDPTQGLPSFGP